MRMCFKWFWKYAGWGLMVLPGIISCQEELRDENVEKPSDGISFNIVDDTFIVSKAAAGHIPGDGRMINDKFEVAGKEMKLNLTVEDNDGISSFEDGTTKGISYTIANVKKFNMTAMTTNGNNSLYFSDEMDVNKVGSIYTASTARFWPNEPLTFFAHYIPSSIASLVTNHSYNCVDGTASGTFTYTHPAPNGNDAVTQKDMLFAISHNKSKTSDGSVGLTFHHALSAIVFKVGKMPEGLRIRKITLGQFASKATCTMSVDPAANSKDNVIFKWGTYQTRLSYSQALDQVPVEGEIFGGTSEYTFMMIPQPINTYRELVIEVVAVVDGVEYPYAYKKKFNEIISGKIEPDKKYTFRIGIEEMGITVTDDVADNVKKNVTITNTGTGAGYVRAAVVGYWVDEQGVVAEAAWNETADGNYVYPADWDTYWIKGSDGFYYYRNPLEAGSSTAVPLFESYTLTAVPPIAETKLHLNIAVQIIDDSILSDGWTIPTE